MDQLEESHVVYSSVGESDLVYVVTKNSVTRHNRHGFTASQSDFSIPKEYYFLSDIVVSGDQFSTGWAGYEESGPIDWLAAYEFETFTKYTGPTPPEEWFLVPVPEETTPLEIGATYLCDSPVKSDTTWLTFSVEKGKSYQLETVTNGCNLGFTLVDNERKMVRNFGDYLEIIADYTGEYHIACMVSRHQFSNSAEQMYSITLTDRIE